MQSFHTLNRQASKNLQQGYALLIPDMVLMTLNWLFPTAVWRPLEISPYDQSEDYLRQSSDVEEKAGCMGLFPE